MSQGSSPRTGWAPLVLIVALFFLWGVANNLNDVLIPHLKKAFFLTDLQSGLVQSAFYLGYFLLAVPASLVMRRFGYKMAIVLGLVLYGTGNGLRAIVRGLLPLALMSPANYVLLMGRMSLPSLIGQAATPLVGGYLLQVAGPMAVLGVMTGLALVNVLLVGLLMRRL